MSNSSVTPETAQVSEAGTGLPAHVSVEAIDGPGRGATIKLSPGIFTIGSGSTCDLVIRDTTVSRCHASLELLRDGVKVRDLQSRNGTRYLGARITEARIPIGASIQVGKTKLQFTAGEMSMPLSEVTELQGMIGKSAVMRALFAQMQRLAQLTAPVLIQGETGVGKERVAKALHALSARSSAPFVSFDCASVSRELVESELFGHVRGAFTGAQSDREGAIELANQGILFLDGVDELPLDLQPKLLRAIEAREFHRVGEGKTRRVNAAFVSSARADLAKAARKGQFRSDLYYRIAGATLFVPPLRERAEDIASLVAQFCQEASGLALSLSPVTLAAFQCDPWPGNVRELKHAVQRVLALGSTDPHSPEPETAVPEYFAARTQLLDKFERDYLVALMEQFGGNVAQAAKAANVARSQLYRMFDRHGLAPKR